MLEKVNHIVNLINKYLQNELTAEESAELNAWISENEENRKLVEELSDETIAEEKMREFLQPEISDGWEKFKVRVANVPEKKKAGPSGFKRFWKVAAFLGPVIIAGIGFLLKIAFSKPDKDINVLVTNTQVQSNHQLPFPADKAELKTADNETITLNNLKDGLVNIQGTYKVYKRNGYLIYIPDPAASTEENLYNTITTPRGGHFRVVLPDRSIITMNVASSITFKVSKGSIREVSITGEAEFNITTNPDQPFLLTIPSVNDRGSTVKAQVLGTRFNVSAYGEGDDKKITLLEGSLNVLAFLAGDWKSANESLTKGKILKKGEQAQINDNGKISINHNVDTSGVVAWKNGYVHFTGPPRKILNTVENWYDIEVIYQTGNLPQNPISGTITPGMNINTVIDIMHHQYNGLHLKYDSLQNRIVVSP